MSATGYTERQEPSSYECGECGGDRDPETSVAGSFCSSACYDDHRRSKRARELLRLLEQDHRFCFTCFAQLKQIHRPTSSWGLSDSVVGFQTRTAHARTGEKTAPAAVLDDVEIDGPPPIDRPRTGTVCECGATDHSDVEPAIRSALADDEDYYRDRVIGQLAEAIQCLRREGKHDVAIDHRRLETADGVEARAALERAVILDG